MNIIGHKKIVSYLEKGIQRNKLHHAYLLAGPENVGKFTVALDLAKKIMGDQKEISPDLVIVRPEIEEKDGKVKKKAINVEKIRELQRRLAVTPEGKHKIAIVDDADFLNLQAQNAILKTLEEPPKDVVIILVAHNQEKLLLTITSRCVVKKFFPVSDEEIAEIVPPADKDKGEIVFWSLGRPGLAFSYINDRKELEAAKKTKEDLKKIISSNMAERFSLAEDWSRDAVALTKKLSLWMVLLRQAIICEEDYLPLSPDKMIIVLGKISSTLEMIRNTNSNTRLMLENIMLEI